MRSYQSLDIEAVCILTHACIFIFVFLLKVNLYRSSTSKADEWYHFLLLKMFLCRKKFFQRTEGLGSTLRLRKIVWFTIESLLKWLFSVFEMFLELCVPFVHSVHLVRIVSLTGTVSKISFSPFSESSGDLFDTNFWISFVVSVSCSKKIIKWDQITTFSF